MIVQIESFVAALNQTQKTWGRFFTALCILLLTLLVDAVSGFSFLSGETAIDLAGFKVVREALSVTYGLLFTLFVATAFVESRLLKRYCLVAQASDSKALRELCELELWIMSPFSTSPLLRALFWILFIDGFLFLVLFSAIHLAGWIPPDPKRMSLAIYRGIGALDATLLLVCIPLGGRLYKNLESVRSTVRQSSQQGS